MEYRVEVVIEHNINSYDSYSEYFETLAEARRFVKQVDDGDPGDKVSIYIDDTLWREYKVD